MRRNHLLEQGEVRIALTQGAPGEQLELPANVERVTVERQDHLARLAAAPATRQTSTDLAYVIFTSGSTGTPKGVMIDHRGAVNTVVHLNRLFGVGREDRVLAVSELTFDTARRNLQTAQQKLASLNQQLAAIAANLKDLGYGG